MSASPETLELLEWISSRRRTYDEAIEAWRSNCPHLAVWDDAFSDGLLQVVRDGREPHVALTSLGRAATRAARASTVMTPVARRRVAISTFIALEGLSPREA
jgi:D-3-phosphoglycerate dehydrogenase